MKILYGIQGTGNGHLCRALDIIPALQKHGSVDLLVSGIQGDIKLPYPVKYQPRGLSFIFGKSGGVNIWKTVAKTNLKKLGKSITALPVDNYDLVINDFEPVSAWACTLRSKPCVALSHQAAVLAPGSPQPEHTDIIGRLLLSHYAPSTSQYGFHFKSYNENIFTPVIRREVREQEVINQGHYTVYLPSYDDDRLLDRLSNFKDVTWEVFSKHNRKLKTHKNITIQPIDNGKFIKSMATAEGVLCGAGFETPAEALYLGKKLLVVPMQNQYEQHLNAAALADMGVPVIKALKPKHFDVIEDWLGKKAGMQMNYPDDTQEVIDNIVERHQLNRDIQ